MLTFSIISRRWLRCLFIGILALVGVIQAQADSYYLLHQSSADGSPERVLMPVTNNRAKYTADEFQGRFKIVRVLDTPIEREVQGEDGETTTVTVSEIVYGTQPSNTKDKDGNIIAQTPKPWGFQQGFSYGYAGRDELAEWFWVQHDNQWDEWSYDNKLYHFTFTFEINQAEGHEGEPINLLCAYKWDPNEVDPLNNHVFNLHGNMTEAETGWSDHPFECTLSEDGTQFLYTITLENVKDGAQFGLRDGSNSNRWYAFNGPAKSIVAQNPRQPIGSEIFNNSDDPWTLKYLGSNMTWNGPEVTMTVTFTLPADLSSFVPENFVIKAIKSANPKPHDFELWMSNYSGNYFLGWGGVDLDAEIDDEAQVVHYSVIPNERIFNTSNLSLEGTSPYSFQPGKTEMGIRDKSNSNHWWAAPSNVDRAMLGDTSFDLTDTNAQNILWVGVGYTQMVTFDVDLYDPTCQPKNFKIQPRYQGYSPATSFSIVNEEGKYMTSGLTPWGSIDYIVFDELEEEEYDPENNVRTYQMRAYLKPGDKFFIGDNKPAYDGYPWIHFGGRTEGESVVAALVDGSDPAQYTLTRGEQYDQKPYEFNGPAGYYIVKFKADYTIARPYDISITFDGLAEMPEYMLGNKPEHTDFRLFQEEYYAEIPTVEKTEIEPGVFRYEFTHKVNSNGERWRYQIATTQPGNAFDYVRYKFPDNVNHCVINGDTFDVLEKVTPEDDANNSYVYFLSPKLLDPADNIYLGYIGNSYQYQPLYDRVKITFDVSEYNPAPHNVKVEWAESVNQCTVVPTMGSYKPQIPEYFLSGQDFIGSEVEMRILPARSLNEETASNVLETDNLHTKYLPLKYVLADTSNNSQASLSLKGGTEVKILIDKKNFDFVGDYNHWENVSFGVNEAREGSKFVKSSLKNDETYGNAIVYTMEVGSPRGTIIVPQTGEYTIEFEVDPYDYIPRNIRLICTSAGRDIQVQGDFTDNKKVKMTEKEDGYTYHIAGLSGYHTFQIWDQNRCWDDPRNDNAIIPAEGQWVQWDGGCGSLSYIFNPNEEYDLILRPAASQVLMIPTRVKPFAEYYVVNPRTGYTEGAPMFEKVDGTNNVYEVNIPEFSGSFVIAGVDKVPYSYEKYGETISGEAYSSMRYGASTEMQLVDNQRVEGLIALDPTQQFRDPNYAFSFVTNDVMDLKLRFEVRDGLPYAISATYAVTVPPFKDLRIEHQDQLPVAYLVSEVLNAGRITPEYEMRRNDNPDPRQVTYELKNFAMRNTRCLRTGYNQEQVDNPLYVVYFEEYDKPGKVYFWNGGANFEIEDMNGDNRFQPGWEYDCTFHPYTHEITLAPSDGKTIQEARLPYIGLTGAFYQPDNWRSPDVADGTGGMEKDESCRLLHPTPYVGNGKAGEAYLQYGPDGSLRYEEEREGDEPGTVYHSFFNNRWPPLNKISMSASAKDEEGTWIPFPVDSEDLTLMPSHNGETYTLDEWREKLTAETLEEGYSEGSSPYNLSQYSNGHMMYNFSAEGVLTYNKEWKGYSQVPDSRANKLNGLKYRRYVVNNLWIAGTYKLWTGSNGREARQGMQWDNHLNWGSSAFNGVNVTQNSISTSQLYLAVKQGNDYRYDDAYYMRTLEFFVPVESSLDDISVNSLLFSTQNPFNAWIRAQNGSENDAMGQYKLSIDINYPDAKTLSPEEAEKEGSKIADRVKAFRVVRFDGDVNRKGKYTEWRPVDTQHNATTWDAATVAAFNMKGENDAALPGIEELADLEGNSISVEKFMEEMGKFRNDAMLEDGNYFYGFEVTIDRCISSEYKDGVIVYDRQPLTMYMPSNLMVMRHWQYGTAAIDAKQLVKETGEGAAENSYLTYDPHGQAATYRVKFNADAPDANGCWKPTEITLVSESEILAGIANGSWKKREAYADVNTDELTAEVTNRMYVPEYGNEQFYSWTRKALVSVSKGKWQGVNGCKVVGAYINERRRSDDVANGREVYRWDAVNEDGSVNLDKGIGLNENGNWNVIIPSRLENDNVYSGYMKVYFLPQDFDEDATGAVATVEDYIAATTPKRDIFFQPTLPGVKRIISEVKVRDLGVSDDEVRFSHTSLTDEDGNETITSVNDTQHYALDVTVQLKAPNMEQDVYDYVSDGGEGIAALAQDDHHQSGHAIVALTETRKDLFSMKNGSLGTFKFVDQHPADWSTGRSDLSLTSSYHFLNPVYKRIEGDFRVEVEKELAMVDIKSAYRYRFFDQPKGSDVLEHLAFHGLLVNYDQDAQNAMHPGFNDEAGTRLDGDAEAIGQDTYTDNDYYLVQVEKIPAVGASSTVLSQLIQHKDMEQTILVFDEQWNTVENRNKNKYMLPGDDRYVLTARHAFLFDVRGNAITLPEIEGQENALEVYKEYGSPAQAPQYKARRAAALSEQGATHALLLSDSTPYEFGNEIPTSVDEVSAEGNYVEAGRGSFTILAEGVAVYSASGIKMADAPGTYSAPQGVYVAATPAGAVKLIVK